MGPVTALGVLGDKLIIFKANSIYATQGDGYNAAGGGTNFTTPWLVPSDVGCANPASVVLTHVGLMFQSRKGIYLLDQQLQLQYIGAAVEAWNNRTITSAVMVPNSRQVRFTTREDVALVYDYFAQRWSVFTNHNAVDACVWNNSYLMLKPSGSIWQEASGSYTDGDGSSYPMLVQTGWLQHAGPQQLMRVYELELLGTYVSPHFLSASIAYDFSPTFSQLKTINAGLALTGSSYQWRIRPSPQLCEAYSLLIQHQPSGSAGECLRLSNLVAKAGTKGSLKKLGAGQSS